MTIWKCPFPIEDHFTLELPHNSRILTIEAQFDQPFIFVLVDPSIPHVLFHFRLVKTGDDFAEVAEYLGSFQQWVYIQGDLDDNTTAADKTESFQRRIRSHLQTWHLFRTLS